METNKLIDLIKGVTQSVDEELFQNIDCFLTFVRNGYEKEEENQTLCSQIDWDDLNSTHLREEFGVNCSLIDSALECLEKEDGQHENTTKFSGIQYFLAEESFRTFCHRSLEELQKKAQNLLGESLEPTPSRKSREMESNLESFDDIRNLYESTKEFKEKAEEYARAADKHLKAVNYLQKRTAQFKLDALNAQHAAESIIPNMLTTLGVFIAIVVAVVGCYLSLILNKHQDPDFPVLNLSVCLLMGHILLNVIFLLMYLISKLTNYTMACHCHIGNQADCSMCPMVIRCECKLPNRIWLRYPYVILLNAIFSLSYVVLSLWSLFRYYLGSRIDQFLFGEPRLVVILAAILVILFVYVARKAVSLMTPSIGLKVAADHARSLGPTEKEEALRQLISELYERVETLEALYDGRKNDEEKTVAPL